MSKVQQAYESLPYPHYVHPGTDPAHLFVVGRLLGLNVADPVGARVLDIGCGSATSLLAIAARLPGARFHGIDFSAPDIASGQALATAAGLNNVTLEHADITAWSPGEARYDYIVAHGVFSWVPDVVKDALLAAIRASLAPNGVALVSYMTYPGCKQAEALRDLLRLRTETLATPADKIAEAHRTLDLLDEGWAAMAKSPYAPSLRAEAKRIRDKEAHYLLLDDLGVERDPCYLMQFAGWAAEHGLRYLGDSDFPTMLVENLPQATATKLLAMKLDQISSEQMIDYISNRSFRSSLLIGPDAAVAGLTAAPLAQLSLSPRLRPAARVRAGATSVRFTTRDDRTVTLRSKPLVAFMNALAGFHGAMTPYADVLAMAERVAGGSFSKAEETQLREDLLTLYGRRELALSSLAYARPGSLPATVRLSPFNAALAQERGLVVTPDLLAIRLAPSDQALCAKLGTGQSLDMLGASNEAATLKADLSGLVRRLHSAGCLA